MLKKSNFVEMIGCVLLILLSCLCGINSEPVKTKNVGKDGLTVSNSTRQFSFSGDSGHKCWQCQHHRFSDNPPCCNYCSDCVNSGSISMTRRGWCGGTFRSMKCANLGSLFSCANLVDACLEEIGVNKPACATCVIVCGLEPGYVNDGYAVLCAAAAAAPDR